MPSYIFEQGSPIAVERRASFTVVDSGDPTGLTPLQLSDIGSFVVYYSMNGANPATLLGSPTITQGDSTNQRGLFQIELARTDIAAVGIGVLTITSTGGTKTMVRRDIDFQVKRAQFAVAQTGVLTPTAFSTDRSEIADDYWKDVLLLALTGQCLGQTKKVGGYVGTTKVFTLATGLAFVGTIVNGDVFKIGNE